MTRGVIALFALFALAAIYLSGVARADDPPQPPVKPARVNEGDPVTHQEILALQFSKFEQSLLRLAQRLEKSTKPADRERAANLKKAIALSTDHGVDAKFAHLIGVLKSSKGLGIQEIKEAMEQNKMLSDDIEAILALLLADNRDEESRKERKRLEELIKQLAEEIRKQKFVRAHTEAGKMDKDPLGKAQAKVTESTSKVAKAMSRPGEGKEGKPKEGNPQQGNPSNSDSSPGKKQVEEANEFQKQAEKKIQEDKKDEASKKQDSAIEKLEDARKRLEEILRQLREEEIERLLAALQQQCERMLQLQIEVRGGTGRVDKAIAENPDKKPMRVDEQRALQLSDREEEIVRLANKAIQLLESEGSAVAFPEVFSQVRDDMKHVARRLGKADVGGVTQGIEDDIINTLKEMIDALKKAQQNRGKSGQGQGGGQQNQALIDLLAELKMIKSMQIRVNSRTRVYSEKYTGEQAADPDIQHELGDLAQRQQKIFDITNNIYRGKNK